MLNGTSLTGVSEEKRARRLVAGAILWGIAEVVPATHEANRMMRMRDNAKVIRVLDWLTNAMAFVAGVIILFVTFLITASVISRILGGDGLPWTLEVTEYSLVYICFLSVPWILKQDAHVKVDFVVERIKKKSERAYANLQRITDLVMAVICIVMTVYGLRVAIGLWQRDVIITSILNWPKAPMVIIIPIGFLVMALQLVRVNTERERKRRARAGTAVREGGRR